MAIIFENIVGADLGDEDASMIHNVILQPAGSGDGGPGAAVASLGGGPGAATTSLYNIDDFGLEPLHQHAMLTEMDTTEQGNLLV